jgi:putative FmdB family regulatory protein
MPTYEFRCPQGHEFEKFYRSISGAEAQAACPICNQLSERMMSATGFAFKGSGFYLTDYGKNAHRDKGTPGAAGAPSGDGAKGESAKSEGAPADAKSDSGTSGTSSTSSTKSDSSAGTSDAKKAAAPEAKPAPAAPKKSTGE